MKKKYVLLIGICFGLFAFAACSKAAAPDTQPELSGNDTEIVADVSVGSTDVEDGDAGKQTGNSEEGYYFEADGAKIAPDQLSKEFLEVLGEPSHYYEVKSCAFEGMDKIYTYASFEITTYPDGEKDYVSSIVLKDDLVKTPEGVRLYMTKEEVLNIYGEGYTERKGMYIYSKGGMELRLIFDGNDECASIEYASLVLNED